MIRNTNLENLARGFAREYGLPESLVCAVCEQESGWNPLAMRYEPPFFDKYIRPLVDSGRLSSSPGISAATEARARAFSWGLMQVMGQTAREHGFTGKFLSELCDPAVGLEIGCRVFAAKKEKAEGDMRRALLLWNGGGYLDYPDEVFERAKKYDAPPPAPAKAAAAASGAGK
jgi:soluble lytic murein transglycosylase-like protein